MTDATIFHCMPWTPDVKQTADDLMTEIRTVAPELELLFMGAAALGLPGKNDIDLDILCDRSRVAEYTEVLRPVLGEPAKTDETGSYWSFYKNGFEIDAIISDPSISHVPLQKARFEKLQSDPVLREEYRQLKLRCDGLPYAEYEKQKIAFLEARVVPAAQAKP